MAAPLRIGVIGAGWIATDHVVVLRRLGHEIAAVCDLDPKRAARLAPEGARTYASWEELLEREEGLDAVWVATPPLLHRAPAVAAMERGLPVFLEKPVARTLDDARAIVAAAHATGVVCAVGYQWHAAEVLDEARRILAGRTIGCLVGQSVGGTQSRPWFLDRAEGGGNLLERGSHHIDLARALAGEIVAVQAAASSVRLAPRPADGGDIDDAVTLILHFASGGIGTIVVAWTSDGLPGSYWVEVTARDAALHLDLDPHFRIHGFSDGAPVESGSHTSPFERSVDRFVTAARAGDPGVVF